MRRGLWTALSILVMVFTYWSPARAQSLEIIDFEDHPANPVGTPGIAFDPHFYADQGVHFSEGGTVLRYEEGFAASGSNGLEMCYSAEFCSTPFRVDFESPQRSVAVSIGYSGNLSEPTPVLMVAYNINGERVGFDEAVLGPGAPVPVDQQLSVEGAALERRAVPAEAPEDLIAAVEIRWSNAERAMNSLVMDDLVHEPFVAFVDFDSDPGRLSFDSTDSLQEIVITNVGNVVAVFDIALSGDAESFELDDTACREDLEPGGSCTIVVGFAPLAEGRFAADVVLISAQLEEPYVIPMEGSLAVVVPPTTLDPGDGAGPADDPGGGGNENATDDEAAEPPVDPTTDSNPVGPLVAAIVLVAVGGGALLVRLWPGRAKRAKRTRGPSRVTATVRVTPSRDTSQITPDRRQPVTAIRVAADGGRATMTLTEEDQP